MRQRRSRSGPCSVPIRRASTAKPTKPDGPQKKWKNTITMLPPNFVQADACGYLEMIRALNMIPIGLRKSTKQANHPRSHIIRPYAIRKSKGQLHFRARFSHGEVVEDGNCGRSCEIRPKTKIAMSGGLRRDAVE